MVRRNFDHDAVFRLLKTDFWPLTRSAVDELENYCLEFGIRDFMWLKDSWPYERKNRFDSSDDDDTYDEKSQRKSERVQQLMLLQKRILKLMQQ